MRLPCFLFQRSPNFDRGLPPGEQFREKILAFERAVADGWDEKAYKWRPERNTRNVVPSGETNDSVRSGVRNGDAGTIASPQSVHGNKLGESGNTLFAFEDDSRNILSNNLWVEDAGETTSSSELENYPYTLVERDDQSVFRGSWSIECGLPEPGRGEYNMDALTFGADNQSVLRGRWDDVRSS